MKNKPDWREHVERAASLRAPALHNVGSVRVRNYVQRWIVGSSWDEKRQRPEQFAAEVLERCCIEFYKSAAPPDYAPTRGYHVEPPSKADAVLQRLQTKAGDGVCVFNGAYAWIFNVAAADGAPFKDWAAHQWMVKRGSLDRQHWPMLYLPKGSWPMDARLIPGLPVTINDLAETSIISAPQPTFRPKPLAIDDDLPF